MRTEQSVARLFAYYITGKSNKTFHMHQFSPHTPNPEEQELTFEQFTESF